MSRVKRYLILIGLLVFGVGIELLVESSIGDVALGNAKGVYNALFGGLLLLARDQVFSSELFVHTLPIAAVSCAAGLAVFALMKKLTSNKYVIWPLVGLSVVALTLLIRLEVTPGLADFSAGAVGALLGAASGAVSGAVLARFAPSTLAEAGRCVLGLCLGALYHFEVATNWTTQVGGIPDVLVGLGEFLAPALFALVLGIWLR